VLIIKQNGEKMKKAGITIFLFILTSTMVFAQLPQSGLKGQWAFDDSTNLTKATVGNDLKLEVMSGVTATQVAVPGPAAGNGAVDVPKGVYYRCTHGIAPNGGGTKVNQYTLVFDFKKVTPNTWSTFFCTNTDVTADDGECFVNTTGHIGAYITGYSTDTIQTGVWYRFVIAADLGKSFDFYLDGKLFHNGGAQVFDGRFALDTDLLFIGDNDGDDDDLDIAQLAIYDRALTADEIAKMGGVNGTSTAVETPDQVVPNSFSLENAYPNPFNPVTNIRFALPVSANVKLTVYNLQGAEVATLVNGNFEAGSHQVQWNTANSLNNSVASGVYFYRLTAQSADGKTFSQSKKVMLLK
jgi:hypothetical protein